MKRIDSVNARPNVNGAGKNGFHDNNDISGQDATYITPNWCNTVQEEIANAIEGFGTALNPNNNAQLLEVLLSITNQIQQTQNQVDSLESDLANFEDIAVNDLFLTTTVFASGSAVAAHKGYGTWERFGDGHALVTLASTSNIAAPSFLKTIKGIGGEYKHQQSLAEMVGHKHSKGSIFNKFVAKASDVAGTSLVTRSDISPQHDSDNTNLELATGYFSAEGWDLSTEQTVGENEPFNIVQSSIAIGAWLRTA